MLAIIPIDDSLLNRIVEEELPKHMESWQNVTIAYQFSSQENRIRYVDDVKRHWVNTASSGSLDALSLDAQQILSFCQIDEEFTNARNSENDLIGRFPIDDSLLNRIVEEQLPKNKKSWQNVTIAYQKASQEYWIRNVDWC